MRLPKEIIVLLVLLVVMIVGVLWYVADRRAKNRAMEKPAATQPLTPAAPKP
jgi:hypothetical protein